MLELVGDSVFALSLHRQELDLSFPFLSPNCGSDSTNLKAVQYAPYPYFNRTQSFQNTRTFPAQAWSPFLRKRRHPATTSVDPLDLYRVPVEGPESARLDCILCSPF